MFQSSYRTKAQELCFSFLLGGSVCLCIVRNAGKPVLQESISSTELSAFYNIFRTSVGLPSPLHNQPRKFCTGCLVKVRQYFMSCLRMVSKGVNLSI
jgi:hypothetical protein